LFQLNQAANMKLDLRQRIDRASRWGNLRLIGNSVASRATIAVPILGYLVLFNSYVVNALTLHSSLCGDSGCGVSWRLQFIYFGCCAVSVGAATYAVWCPSVIKLYPGASNFFDAEKGYFSHPTNLNYLFNLIERAKGSAAEDPFDLQMTIVARNAAVNERHTQALAGVMGEYYVLQLYANTPARVVTMAAYAIGFALLLVPTIYTWY
jgi:hypothetical protein